MSQATQCWIEVNAAKTAVKHGEANALGKAEAEETVRKEPSVYGFNPGMKDQPKFVDLQDYCYSDVNCDVHHGVQGCSRC